MTEGNLIAALKAKDKEALSFLYDKYGAALYGAALRIIQDEEITQRFRHLLASHVEEAIMHPIVRHGLTMRAF